MRKENWPRMLEQVVTENINEPFSWGKNDCVCFAKKVLDNIVEDPLFADVEFNYKDEKGAYELLKSMGYENAWELMDDNFEPIDGRFAQRGDIVGHLTSDKSLGVCLIATFVSPSKNGLQFFPMSDAVCAWRI